MNRRLAGTESLFLLLETLVGYNASFLLFLRQLSSLCSKVSEKLGLRHFKFSANEQKEKKQTVFFLRSFQEILNYSWLCHSIKQNFSERLDSNSQHQKPSTRADL